MKRFLFAYSYTGEAEHDIEAEDEKQARAAMWKWLEETYPNDTAIDILEVEDITWPPPEAS